MLPPADLRPFGAKDLPDMIRRQLTEVDGRVGTPVLVYEGPGKTHSSIGRSSAARTQHAAGRDVPELTGVNPARWADEGPVAAS